MANIEELLRSESDGGLSFGNYSLAEKSKKDGFKFEGSVYKVKTFKDITKLECNESFLYESVPGTAVTGFKENDGGVMFSVDGNEDAQITVGMEDNTTYEVKVDGASIGRITTGVGGKLSFGVELTPGQERKIEITK